MRDKIIKLISKEECLHMVYSFMLMALIYTLFQIFVPFFWALAIATVITFSVGFWKEMTDVKFDKTDLTFDVIGISLYILCVIIQIYL